MATKTTVINFDFATFAETNGTEITFDYFDTDNNGKRVAHITLNGKFRTALIDADVYYKPLIGQTMKVILDTEGTPWAIAYPNATTHPKPKAEALPKEVAALLAKIRG